MKGLSKTEINQTYQVTLDLKEALYSAYKKVKRLKTFR